MTALDEAREEKAAGLPAESVAALSVHAPAATVEVLRHNPALDGVRGTAIALVLLFHLMYVHPENPGRLAAWVAGVSRAGWMGVDLFFALSGFLVTGILFDSLDDAHFFRNFFGRRALRIMPLYYGLLLALYVGFRGWPSEHPLVLVAGFLQNTSLWWRSVNPASKMASMSAHYWSLAVEEQFYLVWPVVMYAVRDRRRLMWIALGGAAFAPVSRVLLLAHGAVLEATYKLVFCRADSLLGGAWLALALRGPARDRVIGWARWWFLAGALLCAAIAYRTGNFDYEVNRSVGKFGYSALALAAAGLIGMVQRPDGAAYRAMNVRPLRFLGRYSYGIYLYQQVIGTLIVERLMYPLRAAVGSRAIEHVLLALIVLAASILVAMASFHWYEKPFLKMKRFLNYRQAGFRASV